MPTTIATKKSSLVRARKSTAKPIVNPASAPIGVCQSCHSLPAGSMEVTALLLVLVFSLTAVLFTSIYNLQIQKAKVAALEAQLSLEY